MATLATPGPWSQAGFPWEFASVSADQFNAQFKGIPSVVDLNVCLDAGTAWSSAVHVAIYQITTDSTDAMGAGRLLWTGAINQGECMRRSLQLDPTQQGIVVFADTASPLAEGRATPIAPGAPTPAEGGLARQSVLDQALAEAKKAADQYGEELAFTTIAGGVLLVVIVVAMIMVYTNPTLPAKVGASVADEVERRRAQKRAA